MRPAAVSACTFCRLTFDHVLLGRRGVKRWRYQSSSMRRDWPSIQPKHRATSTAPPQFSDAIPVCFLAIFAHTSVAVSPFVSSHLSNASGPSKNTSLTDPVRNADLTAPRVARLR